MSDNQIFANGINGRTGEYWIPPLSADELVTQIQGETTESWLAEWFKRIRKKLGLPFLGLPLDVNPKQISQAGWAVVYPEKRMQELSEVLEPLISSRRKQVAPDRFKDKLFYREKETVQDWRIRYDIHEGNIQPKKIPYYILLVGDPTEIPFDFQCLLDIEYAVGRIAFDTLEQYRQYAQSIVDYEKPAKVLNSRQVVVWGTRHPADGFTEMSSQNLLSPLCEGDADNRPLGATQSFTLQPLRGSDATKANLLGVMTRKERAHPPAMLFTSSHGMEWPKGDSDQRAQQGALLCQDWPGVGSIDSSSFLTAEEIPDDAHVHGVVAFMVACYGAGTPAFDSFLYDSQNRRFIDRSKAPLFIADKPFVAALPQRLLSHPQGSALAVVGHVERIWTTSFASPELLPFRNFFAAMMSGDPIGHAMTDFNQRYAVLSAELLTAYDGTVPDKMPTKEEILWQWVERTDAQNYVVLGDPAVRIRVNALIRK